MGLRMKNFYIMGGSLKNPIFMRAGFPKNHIFGGNCLKWGASIVSRFKGELGKKRGGDVFKGGGLMQTMMYVYNKM